jgi:hypothetical protein
MFEIESDPAFDFADPKIAAVIHEEDDRLGLFSDLLFHNEEGSAQHDAAVVFDA